ncbi:MAG: GatB/YqeY domain-containing protein [Caldilineales bacterium]
MTLLEQLDADLKTAMLARDEDRKRTLRSVKTAVSNALVEKRGNSGTDAALSDDEVLKLIQKQASQRRDSIAEFSKAGRNDLVAIEEAELAILQTYLPQQLDAASVRAVVQQVIAESGATSAQQMGVVMRAAMAQLQGRADGKLVNQLVRELLA